MAGVLAVLYAVHLRQLPGPPSLPPGRSSALHSFVAVITGVGLFTAAANYATVEGVLLAEQFPSHVTTLPGVVVYSPKRLHLDAPGVTEQVLAGKDSAYTVRYVGLRLLEHTGRQLLPRLRWLVARLRRGDIAARRRRGPAGVRPPAGVLTYARQCIRLVRGDRPRL